MKHRELEGRLVLVALATILLMLVSMVLATDSQRQLSKVDCCPPSSKTLATETVLSANVVTASLILPSRWITKNSDIISFRAASSSVPLKAGSLSNDGTNWEQPIPIKDDQVTSTTWNLSEDGIGKVVYLRIEDTYGQIAIVVTGTVNVDTTPPISTMAPLPPYSSRTFSISWSAVDATSGIASYDVQVRIGETGAWTEWLTSSTVTSGTYDGAPGETYHFRVRAKDLAGNIEPWRALDATTSIPQTD